MVDPSYPDEEPAQVAVYLIEFPLFRYIAQHICREQEHIQSHMKLISSSAHYRGEGTRIYADETPAFSDSVPITVFQVAASHAKLNGSLSFVTVFTPGWKV